MHVYESILMQINSARWFTRGIAEDNLCSGVRHVYTVISMVLTRLISQEASHLRIKKQCHENIIYSGTIATGKCE